MSWWRAYDESVDDPKLQRMPGELFKAWYNLMCLTSRHGGKLPPIADIAFSLRKPANQVEKVIADLRTRGLIDETDGMLHPHNWNGRQFKSDVSTDRVKEFRKRKGNDPPPVSRNVSSAVSGTPPEQSRAESETEQRKDAANAASTGNGKYAFAAGVIRLNAKDLATWIDAFEHLDVKAELLSLEPWAAEQRDWFHAVKSALAKRNREAKTKAGNASELPLTPSGNRWPDGII